MITVIVILVAALAIAGLLTYAFHKNDNDFPVTTPTYTKEELNNIKLAEELYNKDLRPIVAKKAKTKLTPELEVVEPEFVAKVVEIAKVLPPDATINIEAIVEAPKSTKKKRKYYPKKN